MTEKSPSDEARGLTITMSKSCSPSTMLKNSNAFTTLASIQFNKAHAFRRNAFHDLPAKHHSPATTEFESLRGEIPVRPRKTASMTATTHPSNGTIDMSGEQKRRKYPHEPRIQYEKREPRKQRSRKTAKQEPKTKEPGTVHPTVNSIMDSTGNPRVPGFLRMMRDSNSRRFIASHDFESCSFDRSDNHPSLLNAT